MATYTLGNVTFSAAQEAGLERKLFIRNESRLKAGQALLTKQQYLDSLAQAWPAAFVTEFRNDLRERMGTAIQTASVANLQSVATTLGVELNPYSGNPVAPLEMQMEIAEASAVAEPSPTPPPSTLMSRAQQWLKDMMTWNPNE